MAREDSRDVTLTASRWLPLTPSRVWAACSTKGDLERWWSPQDLKTTVRRLEVRPGGEVVFHIRYLPALISPEHSEAFRAARIPISFDLRGRLTEVIPERSLTFDLTLDIGRSGAGIEMVTRLELLPERGGTRVHLTESGTGTPHWTTLGQQNLEARLARLENLLEFSSERESSSR